MAQASSTTVDKISDKVHQVMGGAPSEGDMTRRIEHQTAKIPSAGFLGLAVGSMILSAGLAFVAQKRDLATFVGLWAPSLLLIGVYNKLVKMTEGDFPRH